MKEFTLNNKTYTIPEANFEFLYKLDNAGLKIDGNQGPITRVTIIISVIINESIEATCKILNDAIMKDPGCFAKINSLIEEEIVNSPFMQSLK